MFLICIYIKDFWGNESPPPICSTHTYSKEELLKASPSKLDLQKASSSHRNLAKTENIEALVANTPKNNVCCVECPPVHNGKKTANSKEACQYVPDIKKC